MDNPDLCTHLLLAPSIMMFLLIIMVGYAGLGEDDLHAVEAVEKFLQGGF